MHPKKRGGLLPMAGIALAATMLGASAPAHADQQPTVVELFTSQGCSDCPPANAAVATLADRPDVLTLSFGVTYWDDLGWKDTFARPQYTQRQWDYAHGLHHADVFTPQVVVDGHADTTGQSVSMIEPLIRAAKTGRTGQPQIHIQPGRVEISAAPARTPAQVWLVRYDPHVLQVPIRRGENGGKTLPHRDVVFELVRLGDWSGPARSFAIQPSANTELKSAVLVQAGAGGRIIGSAKA